MGFSGTFWYIVNDMILRLKQFEFLLLRLVLGWLIYSRQMTGLYLQPHELSIFIENSGGQALQLIVGQVPKKIQPVDHSYIQNVQYNKVIYISQIISHLRRLHIVSSPRARCWCKLLKSARASWRKLRFKCSTTGVCHTFQRKSLSITVFLGQTTLFKLTYIMSF